MHRWTISTAVICLASACCWSQLGPVAEIEGGAIVGIESSGMYSFRGIPYASPPVGELRWAPPQPVNAWPRPRDCRSFAPIAPQAEYPAQSLYASAPRPQSEDCLYLNVWTATMDASEKRPVMFWIHGGAFTRGTGATETYDGTALANKGAVVVTINYRLGVLGFMAHPELSAESTNHASGNYAIMDMVAALEWVRDNISVFGGDPDNVTIFGESAGSWAVSSLIGTPLAKGLFHRAIGQSGASLTPMTLLSKAADDRPSAESLGVQFQEALGVTSLAQMRALSSDQIMAAATKPGALSFRPNVDRYVFPTSVMEAYENGTHNDVPVLIGFNRDEMAAFISEATIPTTIAEYEAAGQEEYGEDWPEISRLYPVYEAPNIRDAVIHSRTEAGFGISMYTWAEVTQKGNSDAYLYYFTRVPGGRTDSYFGAYHAAEIIYVFNNIYVRPGVYNDDDLAIADTISSYWVNFARTGNPNGEGLPEWPAYSSEEKAYMELGDETKAGQHLFQEKFNFWAGRGED